MKGSRPAPDASTPWFYAHWIVNYGEPRSQRAIDPPRRAIARVRLYDGTIADVPVDVVAAGSDRLCVRQTVTHHSTTSWLAWVGRDDVRPAAS